MRKSYIARVLLLPIIVALVTTLSMLFIERESESKVMSFSRYENLMLFMLFYLGNYIFTIVLVAPINIYISKKFGNKLKSLILFNVIGLILIGCIDIWFFTLGDFNSIYLIFPLFSILSFIRFVSDVK
jgi:hypothetical protein